MFSLPFFGKDLFNLMLVLFYVCHIQLLDLFLNLAELSLSPSSEYSSWKLRPKFSDKQFINYFLFDLIIRGLYLPQDIDCFMLVMTPLFNFQYLFIY